jgi:ubiquinone biosynthesis protein
MTQSRQTYRLLHIGRVLATYGVAHLLGRRARWWPGLLARFELAGLTAPQRFSRLLQDLGGSFVKFGQMLALQPDIMSLEYCDELFNLLDRLPPFTLEEVNRVFLEELGQTPDQLFERFEPEPMATASIGQVHRAVLHGRKVAVKVQRPNADADFAGDTRLMAAAIRVIRRFDLRSLRWLLEPMGEFVAWTREELDYRREARYTERLQRNSAGAPHERVPEVFWDLTTRRTFVAEFLEGPTVLEYLRAVAERDEATTGRLRAAGFDPNRFARHVIDNFLGDAFQHGVFHADLHPANLLILPKDVIGYVDFGITGVLSRHSRRQLMTMTLAYTRADVDAMTDAFFKVTIFGPDADPERFRAGMSDLSEAWYDSHGSELVYKKNFTRVMLDMLTLSRATGIWPERDVIKYIRSAIAADGLITRFAPGFNLGRHLEEVCQRWIGWEAQRLILRYSTLSGIVASGAHLAEDGTARAASMLRRLKDGDALAEVHIVRTARQDDRLRRRTLRVAGVVIAFMALFELTASPTGLGVNLFTATAVLVIGSLVALGYSIRKLVAAG